MMCTSLFASSHLKSIFLMKMEKRKIRQLHKNTWTGLRQSGLLAIQPDTQNQYEKTDPTVFNLSSLNFLKVSKQALKSIAVASATI